MFHVEHIGLNMVKCFNDLFNAVNRVKTFYYMRSKIC